MTVRRPIRSASKLALPVLLACACAAPMRAQQLIGYVNTRDADVTGATDVLNGQAVLTASASVTARERTAPITLGRGGTVRVCQTSAVHITESRGAEVAAPLLFSLDRGAIEIQMNSTVSDAIMTPDLRFTVVNKGPLDLRLRVARNGDTCVENRGAGAPTLNISDPFGEALYQVAAGQHVLFEHGSLHEVVDHESSPCGCPEENGMSVADALLASGGGNELVVKPPVVAAAVQPVAPAATQPAAASTQPSVQTQLQSAQQTAAQAAMTAAEQQHPFPAAISEGLAPAAEVPQAAPGATHAQIADSLIYNAPTAAAEAAPNSAAPAKGKKKAGAAAAAAPAAGQTAPPPPPPPQKKDFVHVVGRFFKRMFGG